MPEIKAAFGGFGRGIKLEPPRQSWRLDDALEGPFLCERLKTNHTFLLASLAPQPVNGRVNLLTKRQLILIAKLLFAADSES